MCRSDKTRAPEEFFSEFYDAGDGYEEEPWLEAPLPLSENEPETNSNTVPTQDMAVQTDPVVTQEQVDQLQAQIYQMTAQIRSHFRRLRVRPCQSCGSQAHQIWQCPTVICLNCSGVGHIRNSCPQRNKGRRGKENRPRAAEYPQSYRHGKHQRSSDYVYPKRRPSGDAAYTNSRHHGHQQQQQWDVGYNYYDGNQQVYGACGGYRQHDTHASEHWQRTYHQRRDNRYLDDGGSSNSSSSSNSAGGRRYHDGGHRPRHPHVDKFQHPNQRTGRRSGPNEQEWSFERTPNRRQSRRPAVDLNAPSTSWQEPQDCSRYPEEPWWNRRH